MISSRILTCALLAASVRVLAQTAPAPFRPLETFAPLTLPDPVNSYRSSNGAPGPKYWQNRADYTIDASIDTAAKVLHATEVIEYTNHSPDALTSLWLNAEQNTYRKDARSTAFSGGSRRRNSDAEANNTEGYAFESIEIARTNTSGSGKRAATAFTPAKTVVSDTRLQIQLPESAPLQPGGVLRVRIRYHYAIPGLFGGRTSWARARRGEIYDIAQWYPRMCVYDDLRGWDTQPYLGNEFYLEYGTFHYNVTVPANMLVVGSGELTNAAEVLSKAQLARFAQAQHSDKTVAIRTQPDVDAALASTPAATKTWRFTMSSTRDVSFSASATFLWDAARMNIPGSHRIQLAQSAYPEESAGDAAWGRSTEYLKDAVEHFSQRWYPYPWPNAINVAGGSTGMEYPGILFDGINDKGKVLFWITAHEIGHTWFPMIVGSNERRDAWIDEGFNTFIDIYESEDFAGGVYGPKRDGEYAPDPRLPPADQLVKLMQDPAAPVIVSRADAIRETYRHPVTYFKSAYGLTLLREQILGHERFDHAFRKFIRDWAFKHPSPSDFFRAMSSEGGEDLDYFWRGWYFNNWTLDLAITSFKPIDNSDRSKGFQVTVENRGRLVLPATLRVETAQGSHLDIAVPAETWLQNTTHTFTLPGTADPSTATIDPDHQLPDIDRSNNTLKLQ